MNTEQKAMILRLVAEKRAAVEQSRLLARASYGLNHPVVARLVDQVNRLDELRVAVCSEVDSVAA